MMMLAQLENLTRKAKPPLARIYEFFPLYTQQNGETPLEKNKRFDMGNGRMPMAYCWYKTDLGRVHVIRHS